MLTSQTAHGERIPGAQTAVIAGELGHDGPSALAALQYAARRWATAHGITEARVTDVRLVGNGAHAWTAYGTITGRTSVSAPATLGTEERGER